MRFFQNNDFVSTNYLINETELETVLEIEPTTGEWAANMRVQLYGLLLLHVINFAANGNIADETKPQNRWKFANVNHVDNVQTNTCGFVQPIFQLSKRLVFTNHIDSQILL